MSWSVEWGWILERLLRRQMPKKGDETQWNGNYASREKTTHTHTNHYQRWKVTKCILLFRASLGIASWITMFIGMFRQWALSMHYKCVHTLRTEFNSNDAYCWQVSKEHSHFKMYHGLDHVFDKMKITNYFNEHGVPRCWLNSAHRLACFPAANL